MLYLDIMLSATLSTLILITPTTQASDHPEGKATLSNLAANSWSNDFGYQPKIKMCRTEYSDDSFIVNCAAMSRDRA